MSTTKVIKGLKGVVASYRRGKHRQDPNQVILVFKEVTSRKEAAALLGRKVKWVSPEGKEIIGKILGPHGNSGAVRAKFRTNLPGQALGTPVVIV